MDSINLDYATDDIYNTLILSDSDFDSFYENLNLTRDNNLLNEKEILKVSNNILEKENPITNENMKKYAFNNLAIIKMIIKEVIKINLLEGIQIELENNNIFKLNVILDKFTNEKLLNDFEKYKQLHPTFDSKVHLTIELPKLYYPYAPPVITINEPKFNDIFLFSIGSLEYFKQEYWNPSNTIEYTLQGIKHIINNHAIIDQDDIININNNITKLWHLLSLQIETNNINIEFIKLSNKNDNVKTSMAAGIGYSNSSSTSWDIKKFLFDKKNKSVDIIFNLKEIDHKLSINKLQSIEFIQQKLAPILDFYLYDVNILEITNKINEYEYIISILTYIQPYYEKIIYNQRKLSDLVSTLIETVNDYIKMTKNNDNEVNNLCKKIINLHNKNTITKNLVLDKTNYEYLKEFQFNSINIKQFSIKNNESNEQLNGKRIIREFSSLKKSLPFNYDSSIFFKYDETNMKKIKFMIIGPKDTPYQDGCYIFDMLLPSTYPLKCPTVNFLTTGRGTVRFNPNLYNAGKVCLSLLGTWQGESWNENSTILQVLVSIQSLIFIDHPYFNEPSYQQSFGTPSGMALSEKYNKDVKINNIKWAMIDNIINPPEEFKEIIKIHFSIKKNEIIKLVEKWGEKNSEILLQINKLKNSLNNI